MNRPRRPSQQPRAAGDIEWHFLEARRLMEAGKNRAAMEQAGFGIRLDLDRPDGYLMLGELNLLEGDLLEARRSFAAAAARSRGETRCVALAGSAQVAWIAGDLAEARSLYQEALRDDASDPLNLRPALIEVLLRLDDVTGARRELGKCEDTSADFHVLAALIQFKQRDFEAAVASVRLACLENLYLAAALRAESVPGLGLVHGIEEATPDHAKAMVDRLVPLFGADPGAAAFLAAVAGATRARREQEEVVLLARRLQAEAGERARGEIKRKLDALRDPGRIVSSAEAALGELRRDHPGVVPPGPFEV